jgi:hypothetical protein
MLESPVNCVLHLPTCDAQQPERAGWVSWVPTTMTSVVTPSDKGRADAIRIINNRLTRELALDNYEVWEILFNVRFYLENEALPRFGGGSVRRWWMKTYHKNPDR